MKFLLLGSKLQDGLVLRLLTLIAALCINWGCLGLSNLFDNAFRAFKSEVKLPTVDGCSIQRGNRYQTGHLVLSFLLCLYISAFTFSNQSVYLILSHTLNFCYHVLPSHHHTSYSCYYYYFSTIIPNLLFPNSQCAFQTL